MSPHLAPVFSPRLRPRFAALAALVFVNPFSTRRIDLEREVVPEEFESPGPTVCPGPNPCVPHKNLASITAFLRRELSGVRERIVAGAELSDADRAVYIGCVFYFLYDSVSDQLQTLIKDSKTKAPFFAEFLVAYDHYLGILGPSRDIPAPAHLFAIFYQIKRAFYYLYVELRGRSMAIARLRVQTWGQIFVGDDLQRYQRGLWSRMNQFPTLILGPTGTGKEIVARALGRSAYVAFDAGTMSFAPYAQLYTALNVGELASTLVESELFGHCKGAFTGANREKRGLFRRGVQGSTLFLDEIGELELAIQAKLLRVLDDGSFRRVGDEETVYKLDARILSATNRDPLERIDRGLMRLDFYSRISTQKLVLPSLRERFDERPEELRDLVYVVASELLDAEDALALTDEVEALVTRELAHHPWAGNMREVRACVSQVLATHTFVPDQIQPTALLDHALGQTILSFAEFEHRIAKVTLDRTGDPAEAAQRLSIDVRTLKRMLAYEPAAGQPRGG